MTFINNFNNEYKCKHQSKSSTTSLTVKQVQIIVKYHVFKNKTAKRFIHQSIFAFVSKYSPQRMLNRVYGRPIIALITQSKVNLVPVLKIPEDTVRGSNSDPSPIRIHIDVSLQNSLLLQGSGARRDSSLDEGVALVLILVVTIFNSSSTLSTRTLLVRNRGQTLATHPPLADVKTRLPKRKENVGKNECYNYSRRVNTLSNDIETNPGPDPFQVLNKKNMVITSYNVRGLKDYKKMKRINSFFNQLPCKNNVVICLQETHLNVIECNALDTQWKCGTVQSPAHNNSGGG